MWPPRIFWRNTQKLAIRENCASEENKFTLFVVIIQMKALIAIVYRLQEKNLQIILNMIWIFIIIYHFCMATFQSANMAPMYYTYCMFNFTVYLLIECLSLN